MRMKSPGRGWIVFVPAALSLAAGARDLRVLKAASQGDIAAVRTLIQQRADVNAPYGDGTTPLHWAAHWDNEEMANLLIAAGAAVNKANDLGVTPLWLATQNASFSMAARLLKAGANPNAPLASGETPLMEAARTGNVQLVKLLLAYGAEVDAKEKRQGQTALMWAASQKHANVAQVLLEAGGDVHARTKEWDEYVQYAGGSTLGVLGGDIDLPKYRNGGYTPLTFAARAGDIETAKVLLDAGANIDEPTGSGTTPLVVAAHSGFGNFGEFLLDRGANPNLAGGGYTALHAAILRSDLSLVKALVAHGADPNACIEQATPVGRSSGDYALTLQLIGASALWQAASYNDLESVRVLLASGADARLPGPDGKTAIAGVLERRLRGEGAPGERGAGTTASERTLDIVKLLVGQHVDLNAVDHDDGNAPLHIAASRGQTAIIQYLVDNGADVHLMNYSNQTPLAIAKAAGQRGAAAAELLVKLGAKY